MARTGQGVGIDVVVHGRGGQHPGSAFVRLLLRLEWAHRAVGLTYRVRDARDIAEEGLSPGIDALVVQRDSLLDSGTALAVLAAAGRRGVPVVLDVDDDFFTPEARVRLLAGGYSADRLEALDATVASAERVSVSTEVLAARVPGPAERVHVVANALDATLWGLDDPDESARCPSGGRVLYMGSHTHTDDLALLARVDRSSLDIAGVTGSAVTGGRALVDFARRPVPYPEFVAWLRARRSGWSSGLAPLVDDAFNAAKSDLKFLEYSALGLTTVASDVPPYHGLSREGAVLVRGGPDAWVEALARLRTDPAERECRARTAREYVRTQRTYSLGDGWLQAVLGLAP